MTIETFADDLGVSVEDVLYIARQHGVHGEPTNQDLADVRGALEPMCERSVCSIPDLTQPRASCTCRAMGGREHATGPGCPDGPTA